MIVNTHSAVADLKFTWSELSTEQKAMKEREIQRRYARLAHVARDVVVTSVPLPVLLTAIEPRLGREFPGADSGRALGCLLVAAQELAKGEALPLPKKATEQALVAVARYPELVDRAPWVP